MVSCFMCTRLTFEPEVTCHQWNPKGLIEMKFATKISGIKCGKYFELANIFPEFKVDNSSSPCATHICQWTEWQLIQAMACRLFGAKPLPEPVLAYCQLESWEQISVKFESEYYYFHSRICILNCHLLKWRPFCPRGGCVKWWTCGLAPNGAR